MNNAMIDIQTVGTRPTSAIIALSAIKFDFGSDNMDAFTVNIDPTNWMRLGLTYEKSTIDYWKSVDSSFKDILFTNRVDLESGMDSFLKFLGDDPKSLNYWSYGTLLGFPIISHNLGIIGKQEPWIVSNVMDSRTVFKVFGVNRKDFQKTTKYHNPLLDECYNQIKALKECLS